MPSETPSPKINPAALTVAQAAKVLSAVGQGPVSEETLRGHIAAGLPTGPQETINLVHYAAWLNMQLKERDGD